MCFVKMEDASPALSSGVSMEDTTHKAKGRRPSHCGSAKASCQVPGCGADLACEDKRYCVQRHICIEHLQAESIQCPGSPQLMRFCLQCGKMEPLSVFDGRKRSCRAKLQKRKERRSSKEFKSVTPSSSSTSKSLAQPAPVTTLSEPQQNLLPAAECSFVSGCLVGTTALPWGQHQRQQQPPAQQTMEASDVDYSFEEFSFDQTAAAAAGVCTAAGAQAAASAAPRTSTPPMSAQALDDFETMLSTLLQEELALLSRTEYACSRSTAMPLVQADAGAFNSGKTTGFASSARQSFELSAMPEAPQLSAPASPACWTPGTDGGMLASATNLQMVLPGSRPQALPAHMENAFVQPLGGAQYNSSSAPASLASFAPAAPCVPLMGSMLAAPVVPAAACEASYAGKQANVAKLAAMQNRLVSLELQLSVLMQSSGCPAVVPASHQHFQRINDSRRSPLDCCSFA